MAAFNVSENITVIENVIEDRLIEYFSQRGIDITDIFTAYTIKQNTFNAAWKYCYNQLFKPDKPQRNNRNSLINYDNIDELNAVCSAYLDICFDYHIEPTYFGFSRLTGINMDVIYEWKNGMSRGSQGKPWCEMVKRIYNASQNYTRSELENFPVGQITKANNDTEKGLLYSRQQAEAMLSVAQVDSPEQIAARHRNARLPQKPDLSE